MIVQIFKPLETDNDTFDGNKIGEIPGFTSYTYTKHWQRPGTFELTFISGSSADETKIAEDTVLLVDGDWLIVAGVKPTDTMTTVTGYDFKGYLKQRITLFAEEQDTGAQGYDVISGSTETVMKHYIQNNASEPSDANRKIPGMTVAEDGQRGLEADSYMARLENLSDVEESICTNADVGYTVDVDYANNRIVFDILPKTDKTEAQIVRNRVVFAVNRGNVISLSGERNAENYKNVFYATKSEGDLESDAITQKVLRSGATEATGPYRREVQVNVSADSVSEIETYARHEAENYIMADSYTVEAGSIEEYGTDYSLGDVVTVKDIARGKSVDKVITQAVKSISGAEKSLKLTFGDQKRKLLSGINENVERAMRDIKKIVMDKAAKEDVKQAAQGIKSESEKLSELMANALGVYRTIQSSEDGSEVYYLHDAPTMAESTVIWEFNAGAFAVSTDGGQTWNSGVTADGSIVTKIIETTKIVSDVKSELTGQIGEVQSKIAEIDLNAEDISLKVQNILDNGVDKVVTETGAALDADGLHVTKSGEEMESRIDYSGLYVERDGEEILKAINTGVEAENVTVRTYLTVGKNSRLEDYNTNRTGIFYIGGDS